ncbi:hypothetical protein [Lysobacter claricitrinus]|uniref:hypothetical protein n=1 Tax=Lysobacter claricitrinus TaxID=3367728 RepID=UPI0037DAC37A
MRVATFASIAVLALAALPIAAREPGSSVPVLSSMPLCPLQRVSSVEGRDGREPVANAREIAMGTASYERALREMSEAGAAKGANAVVLTAHNASFYTRGNVPSPRPVYIVLNGVAVRLADPGHCTVRVQDPEELQKRAVRGRGAPVPMEGTATN